MLYLQIALYLFWTERTPEHIAQVNHADRTPWHARNIHARHAGAAFLTDLNADVAAVQATLAQHFAELLLGFSASRLPHKRINQTIFGADFGFRLHLALFVFLGLTDGNFDKVPNDAFNVTTNIANFCELGCFNLGKGSVG